MAQGLSTPDPSLSPTHLSIRRGRVTTTHYTSPFPGVAHWAGLSAGMRRKRVSPLIRKKEDLSVSILLVSIMFKHNIIILCFR